MKKSGTIILSIILILGLIGITYVLVNQSNETETGKKDESNQAEQDNNEEKNEGDEPVNQQKVKADNGLTFELAEAEAAADNAKAFNYIVTNEGTEEIELNFTTSQRYEYELRNITEGTTTKYSKGRAFMQVLGDTKLAPGENVSYDISLPALKPGEYTLTVYLVAKNMSEYVVSESFVIEE